MFSVKMRDAAIERTVLFDACTASLPRSLIFHNFETLPDPTLNGAIKEHFAARKVEHPPIELIRFPTGARLFGGRHFLLEVGGSVLSEQIQNTAILATPEIEGATLAGEHEGENIEDECILVSRFGIMVWGHWVGEILPRIVLSERSFPGRFKFVLPQDIANRSAPRNVWNSIWETIHSLGIKSERIIAARYDKSYVFSKLYCVTPIITSAAFHPNAIGEMRAAYGLNENNAGANRKIAILRTESKARNISNVSDIVHVLKKYGFEFVEVGVLPFREQLHLFATSSVVVGVLASGLTGLLFSPDAVKVLSVAPAGYVNSFFYNMMQLRGADYVDIRGRIVKPDARAEMFSDFHVKPGDLEDGLAHLGEVKALW